MEKKTNFDLIFNSFLIILPVNFFIICIITVYRFVFFISFADFSSVGMFKIYILKAFWMGLRFDLSVAAYINIPVVLVFFLCFIFKNLKLFKLSVAFIKYYYGIIFSLLFFIFFIDFGFFSYFKDHYNFLIFGIFEDDTSALIQTVIKDYRFYIAALIFSALLFLMLKILQKTYSALKFQKRVINAADWKKPVKAIILLSLIVFNFMFARGSLSASMLPIGLSYANISPNCFINKLCVNPVHSLSETIFYKIKDSKNKINLKDKFGYKNDAEIINDLKILSFNNHAESLQEIMAGKTSKNEMIEKIKPNVVLIILEGFGEMPVLNNSSQFNVLGELKEHFEQDTVFYNFLPAGILTINAVESILLNIPPRPFEAHITQSRYIFKHFTSSAALPYKKAGYKTIALYGGSLSWRDLGIFFRYQGFDEIIGEDSVYIEPENIHAWGMNDGCFFKLLKKYFFDSKNTAPKFICAVSTGTHPPYKKLKNYKPLPLEMPYNIQKVMSGKDLNNEALFELYQFANRELAKFISEIKKSKYADNTIIAVTGDHNLRELSGYQTEDLFLKYAVPFYLYIPEKLKNKNINKNLTGSHTDIMPTLYNLSLSDAEYESFGKDLLNISDNISLNMDGLIIRKNIAVKYNFGDDAIESFIFDKNTKKLRPAPETSSHRALKKYYKAVMASGDIFVKS